MHGATIRQGHGEIRLKQAEGRIVPDHLRPAHLGVTVEYGKNRVVEEGLLQRPVRHGRMSIKIPMVRFLVIARVRRVHHVPSIIPPVA